MNDIVGKYRGIKVYKVTLPEYVNGRLHKDEENMYLIDGELIYKNEIFAKYDGNYVSVYDSHKKRTFYTVPIFTANNKSLSKEGYDTANGNSEPEISSTFGIETKTKGVEETFAGVFDTDYFSGICVFKSEFGILKLDWTLPTGEAERFIGYTKEARDRII